MTTPALPNGAPSLATLAAEHAPQPPATTAPAPTAARARDPSKPLTICVFCGASSGTSPIYLTAARSLATIFAAHSISLVYGGGTVGLMGALSSTLVSLSGPSSVHGIIPRALIKHEQGGVPPPYEQYGRTTVVEDMHARKHKMAMEADAFIALPGGFGTMEELWEVVTWSQLGIHDRPVVLFNVGGFWDGVLGWVEGAVREGFVKEGLRGIVRSADDAEGVMREVWAYTVPEGRMDLDWRVEGKA